MFVYLCSIRPCSVESHDHMSVMSAHGLRAVDSMVSGVSVICEAGACFAR